VLAFTEPPVLPLTLVELLDAEGSDVPAGEPEGIRGNDLEIRVPLQEIPDGVYTVTWRTVSSTDGHVSSGSFSFGVGVSPQEIPTTTAEEASSTPPPSGLSVAGRWLLYIGLVVLFACGVTGLLAIGTSIVARPRVLAIAWVLSAAGVVAMTLAERSAIGVSLSLLIDSQAGDAYVRLAAAVVVVGLEALLVWRSPGRTSLVLLSAGASVALSFRTVQDTSTG
jgi:copper transport protein